MQDLLGADAGLAAGFGRARFLVLYEGDPCKTPNLNSCKTLKPRGPLRAGPAGRGRGAGGRVRARALPGAGQGGPLRKHKLKPLQNPKNPEGPCAQDLLGADAGLAAGFARARFLVLDEADRLLEPSFEKELAIILKTLPAERQTLLFSATLTRSLATLRASGLRDAFTFQARI